MKTITQVRTIFIVLLTLCLFSATGNSPASAGDPNIPNFQEQNEPVSNSLQYLRIWRVNSANDSVDGNCDNTHCSLREAIQLASPGETITFTLTTPATITLTGQEILINKDLTIVGPGADLLAISGGAEVNDPTPSQHSRVLSIGSFSGPAVNVSISGVTIRDGRAVEGGGVIVYMGSTMTMSDSVVGPNNIVTYAGGGIANYGGHVTLERCTVTANEGTGTLGGAGMTTAYNGAITTLINTTVSGNITNNYGGGIYVYDATVRLIHSTVTDNIANENFIVEPWGGGAGIYLDYKGQAELRNSLVAGNNDKTNPATAGHPKWPDVYGAAVTLGGNLIGNQTGSTTAWTSTDLVGTATSPIDPMLGELMKNDPGRTLTHALLEESEAIDSATCLPEVTLDQRAVIRPTTGPACDIGAYEVGAPTTLTILPETIRHGEYGSAYLQQFAVVGTNQPVNWTWETGSLNYSCDFNWPYVGGLICYENQELLLPVGSYDLTVSAAEDGGTLTGSRQYTLVIYPLLIFSPEVLPIGRVGQPYDQPVTVSGGEAPYAITKLSGTLPTGLSYDETLDTFTGTPTQPGTFSDIVIQAVDNNGITKTKTYTLTVLPEQLFNWTPETPTSYQSTTFTALPGFDAYIWSVSADPNTDCNTEIGSGQIKTRTFYGRGQYKVCLTIIEDQPYQYFQDERSVTVINYPPASYGIDVTPYRSFPSQAVDVVLYFGDIDGEGEFTCSIDWGDGTPIQPGTVDMMKWECNFPQHVYADAGTYTISATIVDDEAAPDTESSPHQVAYLYAEDGETHLASNSLPTTIDLYAYAPLGTTSVSFNISKAALHGDLGIPTFISCEYAVWWEAEECKASVVFTPVITTPLYEGDDLFEFTVTDTSAHTSDPAEQPLWLHINTKPTATDGTATVSAAEPSQFGIFGKDMDAVDYKYDQLSFHIDQVPANGTLTLTDEPDTYDWFYDEFNELIGVEWSQLLTYTPNDGTTALTDSFTFHVNDGMEDSELATITLTIHAPRTLHVNTNDDLVDAQGCDLTHCSLREAVADAEISDTIDFVLTLPNTITLTQAGGGELLIKKNIHILGPGANELTISAGFTDPEIAPWEGFRVFRIFNDYWPMTAEIAGLTIRDGRAGKGGGIYVDEDATLNLHDCVIGPNNIVSEAGGGISIDYATANLENVTVVGNHGTGSIGGAGIFVDTSTLTMINSTISGNVTNNFGGGMMAYDRSDVTLIHTTISGNTANQNYLDEAWGGGGGIYIDEATVILQNSIVGGNTDLSDPETASHPKWPDVSGEFTSLGGNLIGDGTGSSGWQIEPVDLVGTAGDEIDPLLDSLEVHEPGTTPTYSLQSTSWAVDAVICVAGVTTDQRGVTRPQGTKCDIGAYELENVWKLLFLPLINR